MVQLYAIREREREEGAPCVLGGAKPAMARTGKRARGRAVQGLHACGISTRLVDPVYLVANCLF